MSWWGKLIGGAVGFSLGGPLGAVLGAALGHGFDARRETPALPPGGVPHDPSELLRSAFFTATFSVMGHMAKADGRVTRDEIELASTVMARMALPEDMRELARSLFRQGKSSEFPLDDVLEQLRGQTRSRNLLRMFLEIQVFAAYIDGHVHARERGLLERICAALGFDGQTLAQVERLVRAELAQKFSGSDSETVSRDAVAEAYALLNVSPNEDDASIKRSYRRAMSQHHPDKLVSKGLPEEMMQLATAKTQEIKAAYELIKRARSEN